MKKQFTLTFITFFSILFSSQAQVVNKGDKLFGGTFSIYFTNGNGNQYESNSSNAGVYPSFGWAIKENLVMGVRGSLAFNHQEYKDINLEKNLSNSFSFGPGIFFKKYKTLKNKFGAYFDHSLSVNYNSNKNKNGTGDVVKSHSWGGYYNFNPGVFYKFSENFIGEANIGGVNASYSTGGGISNYRIGASFLQQFNLGISYRIPQKKSS